MAVNETTPGPWTVKGPSPGGSDIDDGGDYAILDEERAILAEVYRKVARSGERPAEANAHLIAAAPKLLAALKALVPLAEAAWRLLPDRRPLLAQAREAIREATS